MVEDSLIVCRNNRTLRLLLERMHSAILALMRSFRQYSLRPILSFRTNVPEKTTFNFADNKDQLLMTTVNIF